MRTIVSRLNRKHARLIEKSFTNVCVACVQKALQFYRITTDLSGRIGRLISHRSISECSVEMKGEKPARAGDSKTSLWSQ